MNLAEKLAATFIVILFTSILYFNADNEKRIEQQIVASIDIHTL